MGINRKDDAYENIICSGYHRKVRRYHRLSETKWIPEILVATNGDEALRHLYDHAPDFVILDINLPILDGFQLCRIIKSGAIKNSVIIPVVLLSGTDETHLASQLAKSVGAYGILHAPIAMEDLLHLIYHACHPEKVPADKAIKQHNQLNWVPHRRLFVTQRVVHLFARISASCSIGRYIKTTSFSGDATDIIGRINPNPDMHFMISSIARFSNSLVKGSLIVL